MKSNSFKELLENNKIRITNNNIELVIQDYSFLEISSVFDFENNQKTYQLMDESKIIIISEYKENNFILVFERTIIYIKQTSINFLYSLLSNKKNLKICFLSNSKELFEDHIQIQYEEIICDETFKYEISNFIERLLIRQLNSLFRLIFSCIAGYLIKTSYIKNSENRLHRFEAINGEQLQEKSFSKDEFIFLRDILSTPSALIQLYYYIEKEVLVVIKTSNQRDNKLIEREINNYRNMNHPFIPRFYGTIQEGPNKSLVIEYINGQPLSQISKMKDEEKIAIIFDLLCIFSYLKSKEYIYRDLKPNNVIFDKNKQIVLIDFDSMINFGRRNEVDNSKFTTDFSSVFVAPEINRTESGIPSYQSDVYSLGQMISFILTEILPSEERITNDDNTTQNNELNKILLNDNQLFKRCIEEDHIKRPTIEDLFNELLIFLLKHHQLANLINSKIKSNEKYYSTTFYNRDKFYIDKHSDAYKKIAIHYLSLAANHNHPEAQFNLGAIYYKGEYITRDINKAIYYFSLAANNNHPEAQFILGAIYYKGEYITRDINKAIYYFSLAANNNHPEAQFILGVIYYEGEYITRDINKAIYYFSLAANNNHPGAQFILGVIYYKGEYITRDINKAIYYFSLAANHNHPEAQINLGAIYYKGEYITRDINKAIHYFSLAANHNHPGAQFNLGVIYYEGEYITRDINKAIHYFSLAANNNHPEAQFNLGVIYYEGEYITRDINKAIHYYSLAANQSDSQTQFNLGDDNYLLMYIKKSIHYLIRSAMNGCKEGCFAVGYLYHEGKYMERNIEQSIRFYKEASSFNIQYAKNNLGIIYKKGFEDKIEPRLGSSIEYFEEAIRQKNDKVSMYNLAHLYLYEEPIKGSIDKSIDLLVRSLNEGFYPSLELLCISLIKKYGNDVDSITTKLNEQSNNFNKYKTVILSIIGNYISNKSLYESKYLEYKTVDFLYNVLFEPIQSDEITKEKEAQQRKNPKIKEISKEFYEGFGFDLN